MGAINKHPSCKKTWKVTTQVSREISLAFASLFSANAYLEMVLLGEFENRDEQDSIIKMNKVIKESTTHLSKAKQFLVETICIAKKSGDPYKKEFGELNSNLLSGLWNNRLLVDCKHEISKIVSEVKDDHLSTSERFVSDIEKLENLTDLAIQSLQEVSSIAHNHRLREALANNEIPLQANFGLLISTWLFFMKEYLIDSLVATEVAFNVNKAVSLVA